MSNHLEGRLLELCNCTLTVVAMLAFAANSLLSRLALQQAAIDPASIGSVRLVSLRLLLASAAILGGIALVLFSRGVSGRSTTPSAASPPARYRD